MTVINSDITSSFEDEDVSPLLDDDITTRGMARLSSAATCLVAGVEYTHGQQIYRADPCEFCLCLDGEMFCWWQDCPPTLEGPCKNQGPFSPCASIPVAPNNQINQGQSSQSTSSTKSSTTTRKPKKYKKYIISTQSTTLSDNDSSSSTDNDLMESSTYTETSSTSESDINSYQSSTTEEPKSCIVMGQKYKVGDNLPHSTGNCLECICGQGGKITCSPHQCVPAGDEINDYRPLGSRQGNDVFK